MWMLLMGTVFDVDVVNGDIVFDVDVNGDIVFDVDVVNGDSFLCGCC